MKGQFVRQPPEQLYYSQARGAQKIDLHSLRIVLNLKGCLHHLLYLHLDRKDLPECVAVLQIIFTLDILDTLLTQHLECAVIEVYVKSAVNPHFTPCLFDCRNLLRQQNRHFMLPEHLQYFS
jgi:hypothetical protein